MIENKHKITMSKVNKKRFYGGALIIALSVVLFLFETDMEEFSLGWWILLFATGFVLFISSLPFIEDTKKNKEKLAEKYIKR